MTCGASTPVEHLLATQVDKKAPAVPTRALLHRHELSQGAPHPMAGIKSFEERCGGLQTHCWTQFGCETYAENDWIEAMVGMENPLEAQ